NAEAWFHCGDGAENIKQRGVGGNLQVEIDEAVHQNSGANKHGHQGYCAVSFVCPVRDFLTRLAEDRHYQPQHDCESHRSGFHKQLDVIIVRFVHVEIGIEAAKLRINVGKCAQPPSEDRFREKHLQTVTRDVHSGSTRQLSSRFV